MADKVHIPREAPGPASESSGESSGEGSSHQFGLTAAMALIVGSIIGVGALNGWTMICAEMPLAAAKDGLFPERFKRMSKNGVPAFGIIASTVLASAAMIINYLGSSGATVFTTLVLMTGITAAIPYGFSALAQLKWRWVDHRTLETPRFARDMIVAGLSLVFSILFIVYSRNTGHSFWVYWAPFFLADGALLLGIPVYLGQRRHMSQPAPVPPYREFERGG
jgi:basic amino acid/polyamine antiporter, APA family